MDFIWKNQKFLSAYVNYFILNAIIIKKATVFVRTILRLWSLRVYEFYFLYC